MTRLDPALAAFCREHDLPRRFAHTAAKYYVPLARRLVEYLRRHRIAAPPLILGIHGAQGTGKTTLAALLARLCETSLPGSVAVLSLDDFYLTRAERQTLGATVHPLLRTRGVPGTHDIALLHRTLDQLNGLATGRRLTLPRFCKATDDRLTTTAAGPSIVGPVALIILEGWCIGARPQTPAALAEPVNELEKTQDPDGRWRQYVNEQLATGYAEVFSRIDRLLMLRAPNLGSIIRWRQQQERQLARRVGPNTGNRLIKPAEIQGFVRYFERITRDCLRQLPDEADVTVELDGDHDVSGWHEQPFAFS